jgi:hypothetical protein
MTYVRWWHSFLIALSVATWNSQPMYSYVVARDLFKETTGPDVLLFMSVYQGMPLALLGMGSGPTAGCRSRPRYWCTCRPWAWTAIFRWSTRGMRCAVAAQSHALENPR